MIETDTFIIMLRFSMDGCHLLIRYFIIESKHKFEVAAKHH